MSGPYTVVNVDNGYPIRYRRFGDVYKAFNAGDLWAMDNPGKDFKVLNAKLSPIARPRNAT